MSTLPYIRTITAGKTFISPTDYTLYIDTTSGIATVVLPKIETLYSSFKNVLGNPNAIFGFRFLDIGNNASVNKIVFEGMDDDKVNGGQIYEVTDDGASGLILVSGGNNYILVNDNLLNSISGNLLQTKLLFKVDYNDLNSFPAVQFHTVTYLNSVPTNSVIISGIYKINQQFISSSGNFVNISPFFNNQPTNNFIGAIQTNINFSGKYFAINNFKDKIDMQFTSCNGVYDFRNSLGVPTNNPQNWTSGEAEVYILYTSINL
jgi:hypothetical protein